ncbi:MAG: S8 family serine peptidase [Planctomycetota bacterium]
MMRSIVCLIVGLAFAPGLASAQDSVTQYHYRYEKRNIEILLDTSRVAIFAPGQTQADLLDAAAALNIETRGIDASVIEDWHYLELATSERLVAETVELLVRGSSATFVTPVFELDGMPRHVTPWVLAGQAEGVTDEAFVALAERHLDAKIETLRFAGFERIHRLHHNSRNGFVVLEQANAFDHLPEIGHSSPDWFQKGRKDLIPNDAFFGDLWGIRNVGQGFGWAFDQDIDGSEAWDTTTGVSTVVVVVLDDGAQMGHPDLNALAGQDFTTGGTGTGGEPGNSCDNHGTAVAGCIAAKINNSIGVVGVAPDCRVRSAKIGDSDLGSPCPNTFNMFDSWFVSALGWSQSVGDVTNASVSLGFGSSISSAYTQARAAGVIHFASSGNDSDNSINYPASLSTVNAVGAMDPDGTRAGFSNFGTGLAFSAPGVEIATTDRTGGAGYSSGDYDFFFGGTSAASPYAAGVAALGLSVDPTLTPSELEALMEAACVDRGAPGYDTTYGWGFVNANNLVDSINVDPTDPPVLNTVLPSTGPVSGGTLVTITGENFTADTTFIFGANNLQNVVVVDPETVTGTTPANTGASTVTVFVVNSAGSDNLPDAFTYSDNSLAMFSATATPGGTATIIAVGSHDQDLSGYSVACTYDTNFLDATDVTTVGTGAEFADFIAPNLNDVEGWWTLGVVMDLSPPLTNVISAGVNNELAYVTFDVESFAPIGFFNELMFEDGVGNPPVDNIFAILGGTSAVPALSGGIIQIVAGVQFIRGDVNSDNSLDIADPIAALEYLFSGGTVPCLDAVDANDDGSADIGDPIYSLEHLFSGGPQPPAPFPNPGLDPTSDSLGCN